MKLKIKLIAIAAALASLAGGAQADILTTSTNNGSMVLTVFNQATKAWYMRDLGFTINSFLPSAVLASVGDPSSVLVGDKTPNAGLVLNASNTTNFGDANWGTWFSAQTANDLRWNVTAIDTNQGTGNGVRRMVVSSANIGETATNGNIDNFINTSNAGSASAFFGTAGLSSFNLDGSAPYQTSLDSNFGLQADGLATIGQDVRLFYFAKTTGTSGSFVPAVTFGNTTGAALISLAANGNFSYTLAGDPGVAPVPLPAAAWMMGAGLMALGGMIRRRKAAAQA